MDWFKTEDICCGCSACEKVCPKQAIAMKRNEKGFELPVIDSGKCIRCGLCEKVCAFSKRLEEPVAPNTVKVYGLKKKKGREKSQSGGAFAAFAEFILSRNGVVYGVACNGKRVFYKRIDKIRHLDGLKGSKYVQAKAGNVFEETEKDLLEDKWVLFSGTACHLDGLKSYLKKRRINAQKLFLCDLVCHGVPSPLVYEDYYEYLENKFGGIRNFDFRKKLKGGWHGHIESFVDKKKHLWITDNYTKIFYSHLELRESCYQCPYASMNRISDITIGDFWGIEKVDAVFHSSDGVSLVIVNSEKGQRLFESIESGVVWKEFSPEQCKQPNLYAPTNRPEAYDEFWKNYMQHGFKDTVVKYCDYNEKADTHWTIRKRMRRWIAFYMKSFLHRCFRGQ